MSTIGVLHPGELGSALGRHLVENGHRVVVTLQGRSERTRRLCREAALTVLPSLRHVVAEADVIVSAVPPGAAMTVARRYAALAAQGTSRIYVDLCSISPATAQEIAGALEPIGIQVVDGAIHGQASRLHAGATLFLSGARAPEVASLLGRAARVKLVGDLPGQASALKMFLSGMSKGMCALFLEMGLAAREHGCLPELLEACDHHYPATMDAIRRMLPTYPVHARRRVEEMHELAATLRALGREPRMAEGASAVIEDLARWDLPPSAPGGGAWSVEEVIESAHRLAAEAVHSI